MKLAAIDIGSNAVRCQISSVLNQNGNVIFKKVEYVRYPIRFGEDVFNNGYISEGKVHKFVKLLKAFQLLLDVHEVNHYMICATSAMRSALNAPDILECVRRETGFDIQVIDGETEAYLINKVIFSFLDERNYLHIDVGGGSTEFNIYVNREKMASQSFEQGSIRHMQGQDSVVLWERMKSWIEDNSKKYHLSRAIGTGGNINKIFELAGKITGKPIYRKQIEEVAARLNNMSMHERITDLLLNPDRADVIVPAAEIYLSAMKWAKLESMIVPNVGLKDGMLHALYEQHHPERFVITTIS
ncbi:Ppx/GppA phosphatase family protein [Pontibacter akesuensis]|uniref:Exopolyphosphatase / guanosine-5'-triphosphate,3'-diphosphate pyrophosphatase n=1 Tax=Pontibacter akesuensis TaxID=388950 RepID=A0A1I7KET4_9BACT|nr:phosphatase [Pontibacter akesuensis]GHA79739.1 exopolyphosphatase [Pontibacter akesuensis]SFU95937.1 exopolyphosphatase / guanosine-5'-triphosphate,3'-diphosphate pyrophosphatase [Pontibacter akesuensis]